MKKLNIFEKFKKSENNKIIDKFNSIISAMFNTYLVSTLKFQFEKNDKFNNITSAMFNAYLISTLKYEKIKCFWVIQKIWKNYKINNKKKSEKIKLFERFAQQTQRPPTWKTAEIELWLSAAGITCV